jgi:hypothetical protein
MEIAPTDGKVTIERKDYDELRARLEHIALMLPSGSYALQRLSEVLALFDQLRTGSPSSKHVNE